MIPFHIPTLAEVAPPRLADTLSECPDLNDYEATVFHVLARGHSIRVIGATALDAAIDEARAAREAGR